MFTADRADIRVRRTGGQDMEQTAAVKDGKAAFAWDDASAVLGVEQTEAGTIGRLDLDIRQHTCEHTNNLVLERPVSLRLHTDMRPEAVTSLYMFGDWWTRPAFSSDFSGVPDRTQVALIAFADSFACFVPMVGSEFKTVMGPGGEDWISLSLTAGRGAQSSVHEPLFICTKADTIYEAISSAFRFLAKERNIPLRTQRTFPEIFEYLGWCSWDAFYRDVDAEAVRRKAEELQTRDTHVRWILIDDGWLSVRDDMLWDYAPDPVKFHGDFTNLIRSIKDETDVRWVGAWRALSGYWAGVHPEGPLAHSSREDLLFAGTGRVLPKPDTAAAFRFSDAWHRQLRAFGVDFVKVDVQGAVKNHYEGNASLCSASKELLEGLDASTMWFGGTMINCMGMAMEDILSRPMSAVSRNSDDFFPAKVDSFREHLVQNAYNALYHGEMYWPDWDMFWTSHPHAEKHALLRAVSGGPVYCSDRLGETNPDVLRPLAYEDGKILRMARPAVPAPQCIFEDPEKSGVLVLSSVTEDGRAVAAAFNITDSAQEGFFVPEQIPGLCRAEKYIVYAPFDKKVLCEVPGDKEVVFELSPDGCALFQVVPWEDAFACLGRADKYMGIAALEGAYETADGWMCVLREQGPVAFASSRGIERVYSDSIDVTDQLERVLEDENGTVPVCLLHLPVVPERAAVHVVLEDR